MSAPPSHWQAARERPWRRYDQDAASTATAWLPAVAAPMRLLDSRGATYRLDVELGSLEFEVHPYMSLEHQLVSGVPASTHARSCC
jgi:predicted nuclease with RNAse H fold